MRRMWLAVAAGVCTLAAGSTGVAARQGAVTGFTPTPAPVDVVCRDPLVTERARATRVRPLAVQDGRALRYDQEPRILSPEYGGTIALRDFMVAGDVPSVQFQFADGAMETWTRERTQVLSGRLVSVFQPSWPASALDRAMIFSRWGWDFPTLLWGTVIGGGTVSVDPVSGLSIAGHKQVFLRIASSGIPNVAVAQVPAAPGQLAPDVQYSSHVVNIALPTFGDAIVLDEDDTAEVTAVTRRFFQLFEDSYDAIALVPQSNILPPYNAVHQFVKNDVAGIGHAPVDRSVEFGSASGRLKGLEIYPQFFQTNKVSNHETGHQWGSYVDWTALNGLERAGHQTSAHDPLWANHPSFLSSVLDATRRAVPTALGGWEIQQSPAPIGYSPLLLYSMGVTPKEAVPDIVLFDNQTQFTFGVAPDPGTPVTGPTRTATIHNVVGLLGERTGPVPAEWQRATIVVSRGALLSQREMNYWTFFAQRNGDPNRSGVIDYEGYGSFDLATGNLVDMVTTIRPLPGTGAAIVQPLGVDYPNFAPTDLRGLTLNAPIATLYTAGQTLRVTGTVVAGPTGMFNRIAFRLSRFGVPNTGSLTAYPVGGGGTFAADIPFPTPGRFQLELFLLTPDATSVTSRFQVSTFTVAPAAAAATAAAAPAAR